MDVITLVKNDGSSARLTYLLCTDVWMKNDVSITAEIILKGKKGKIIGSVSKLYQHVISLLREGRLSLCYMYAHTMAVKTSTMQAYTLTHV